MADELQTAYLIGGSDSPKVERAVARLRSRFEGDAVELHHAETMSGEDAVAACNAMGLFGGGSRLVLIEGVETWKAPDVKALAAYLASPAPGTTLALVAGDLKKDAPLAKAVAGHGTVLLWDVMARKIPQWIAEQFTVHGTRAEPEACRLLTELVGERPARARRRGRQARHVGGRRGRHRRRRRGSRHAAGRIAAVGADRRVGRTRRRRGPAGRRADARPDRRPGVAHAAQRWSAA